VLLVAIALAAGCSSKSSDGDRPPADVVSLLDEMRSITAELCACPNAECRREAGDRADRLDATLRGQQNIPDPDDWRRVAVWENALEHIRRVCRDAAQHGVETAQIVELHDRLVKACGCADTACIDRAEKELVAHVAQLAGPRASYVMPIRVCRMGLEHAGEAPPAKN
jgi:hypothetical protein